MSSEPNNETSNTVHDAARGRIVQAGTVRNIWLGGDKRMVLLLALTLVVVVVAAAVIAWQVRKPVEPNPLGVDTSVTLGCELDTGWVLPEPGSEPVPYSENAPPGAVLGSGGVVTATVQGLWDKAVVLQSMRAEVLNRKPAAPGALLPAECQSDVVPKYFSIDLSAGSPTAVPMTVEHDGKQIVPKDFPFKVDPSDVEQFKVRPHSSAEDVEWVLWLRWSAGTDSGEFRIDDKGKPFRTTATAGSVRWCADRVPRHPVWRPTCG